MIYSINSIKIIIIRRIDLSFIKVFLEIVKNMHYVLISYNFYQVYKIYIRNYEY